MIDFEDEIEVKKQLESAINYLSETKSAFIYTDNREQIFSRRNQTSILAEKLNSLLD